MKKLLPLLLIAIVIATAVVVPAASVAQAADDVPVTLAPSDPCGGGAYPNANPFVVIEWICTYVGLHGAQVTTAKVTPCYVMFNTTCRNGSPRIIPWKSYADVEFASAGVNAGRVMYRLCIANMVFFRDTLQVLGYPSEDVGDLCGVLLAAGSVTIGCVYAGNITAYLQAYAAELEQAGRPLPAAVFRSWATSWAAATASICSLPAI